ncbi:MAG TPA: mechanosensitive ion channel domain-containing protein [Vicinamibacterales bacterium]|nr:mechanosensitive ion channel domain-containing protein [Vicinamibacterales bacterium]
MTRGRGAHRALLALATVATLMAGSQARAQQGADPASEVEIATAPVTLDGAVLFHVRGVASFPAPVRARRIEERLAAVAADPAASLDSFRIADTGSATRILAGAETIMMVVDADAQLEQVSRADLAASHLARLRQAAADYRAARSPAAIRRSIIMAAVGTLVLALVIGGLVVFWRWLDPVLTRRLEARIHTVHIQSFEVMRAERIWSALRSGVVAVRTIVFLAVALAYLGFVFARFPWTRGLPDGMAAFALGPVRVIGGGVAGAVPSLIFLTVLFIVMRMALRVVRFFFDAVAQGSVTLPNFDRDWAEPTYKIVRTAIVAFTLIVAYPYVPGSQTEAFKGISIFIGIVFSLGSSSAISNILAGYMLTYRRALKIGDRVKIGTAVGEVIATRLQVTHLRSMKNEEIIIPNSQIMAAEVLNYSSLSRARGLILHTDVGIGYEVPWRQVEAMLMAAAGRTAGLCLEPRPFVLEKQLGDFAVMYELNVYCRTVEAMPQLYAELHRNILDLFNEHGVQIMTPAYEGDPLTPKVVPRGDWYAAPAVRPGYEMGARDSAASDSSAAMTPPAL